MLRDFSAQTFMLNNKVTLWRQQKGVSKAHLARRIGVSRSYVTRLEQGNLQPSAGVLFRIAGYFKCRVEDIFEHVPDSGAGGFFTPPVSPISQRSDIHNGLGQAVVQPTGCSARPSSGKGEIKGQIVGRSNGEGCGVACRVSKPKGKL
jgi:putative transcriptional regulator